MSDKLSFKKALTLQMAARGYQPYSVISPYVSVLSFEKMINSEMKCYISFRYMPAWKAYDVIAGTESVLLQAEIEEAITDFSELGGHFVFDPKTAPTSRIQFNTDIFTKERFGDVLPSKVDSISAYLDSLFESAIMPIFECVTSREGLLRLLLRSEPPFNSSYSCRRLLFIAKLVSVTGTDWAPVKAILQSIERAYRNDAYLERYQGQLIDDVYKYFSN